MSAPATVLDRGTAAGAPVAPFPNFLIVGVMKAATTALASLLDQHPAVHIPARELHFFDRDDRYSKGIDFYRSAFHPGPGERQIGEKTPTYSYHPPSAARIAAFNPEMRLIWIFRNPTERAYSHYWYFRQNGQERHDFERALALEPARRPGNIGYSYLDRGLYADQVNRFLERFPREQMLFLLYETFRKAPATTARACLAFLGEQGPLPPAPGKRRNVTFQPRSVTLQWVAYHALYGRARLAYRLVSRLNRRPSSGYPPMAEGVRARLDAFYAPHNAALARLTGLDLSGWS